MAIITVNFVVWGDLKVIYVSVADNRWWIFLLNLIQISLPILWIIINQITELAVI